MPTRSTELSARRASIGDVPMPPRPSWPPAPRLLADAVEAGLRAARDGQPDDFAQAMSLLVRADREQLATLLGAATQALLERVHPDGLDGDAARLLLDGSALAARAWYADVDEDLLLRALVGALGIGEHPDAVRADPDAVLAHGVLLVAELIRLANARPATVVDQAMAELFRAQTVELP